MDQDDKTAGMRRGVPVSRSTAPAGTPYPVAPPSPAPFVPVPTASQPRTVGGHTARLLVPEEEPLVFDSFGSSSLPLLVHDGPPVSAPLSLEPEPRPPPPPETALRSAAGTMRLPTASPDAGDTAKQPPLGPAAPSPKPTAMSPVATTAAAEGSLFLARLFAPVSVAVGLVFFAMGSMIALTVEGRLIQFSITSAPPPATVSSPASPPPPTVVPPPPPPVVSAVVPVTPSTPPGPTVRPPAVPGARPPGQTTKRPALPFP